ncbi:hypothetical protein DICVIV_10403 [Dictyocaulus viviparus]|uniref:Uncharacterized protein n=1 Tax=Dictyocaulus viviparus TaxID=29172 RepID=A0A0D8XMF6_DICVI|nr:hypothetical protein DICVIV_10403 [Dictyocaulus viviparus]
MEDDIDEFVDYQVLQILNASLEETQSLWDAVVLERKKRDQSQLDEKDDFENITSTPSNATKSKKLLSYDYDGFTQDLALAVGIILFTALLVIIFILAIHNKLIQSKRSKAIKSSEKRAERKKILKEFVPSPTQQRHPQPQAQAAVSQLSYQFDLSQALTEEKAASIENPPVYPVDSRLPQVHKPIAPLVNETFKNVDEKQSTSKNEHYGTSDVVFSDIRSSKMTYTQGNNVLMEYRK